MLPTGHLSVVYLLHRFARVDLRVGAVAVLFPDLIDKPLKLLHLVPGGRSYAHGLPAVALVVILLLFAKRDWAYSWLLGHLSHLLADYPLSGYVPWFFPFVPQEFPVGGPLILVTLPEVLLDLGAVALAVGVWYVARRRRHSDQTRGGA